MMVNTNGQRLLRVGELSRRTGVSTSAINYYVREGLLPQPLKTAPNMAYYDPGYVDILNSIKVLQREKGLTLSEIKRMLERGKFRWPEIFPSEDFSGVSGTAAGSRRALDRRRHIMIVSADVFAEKGYYATTINDLARAAGIAKGTIYWYFKNKKAIMLALLDDISREITVTFTEIMETSPNGLVAILDCVQPALELLDKHGPIYLMYFMEIGSTDSAIRKKFRDIYRTVQRGTSAAIYRGINSGVIRSVDPVIAAYAVMGLVERVSQVGEVKSGPSLDEKAREAREMLRRALARG
jgi:AcrR family transcriptional regulator/predicted DNA-binding transcriptional regulator AlpA